MKKTLSILLVLLFALGLLPAGAAAAEAKVVLSGQNLRVDGKRIQCEKYNIDGANYFKLRDIAYVLSGTGSSFSVSWDGESRCISIVTGEDYTPNGTELDLAFGDKSASAAPSGDRILVNGEERTDLSAYKLEGNNFYKLRDLGDALGFTVDYDRESNTAFIISHACFLNGGWRTVETLRSDNAGGSSRDVETYDENGYLLTSLHESGGSRESCEYVRNAQGFETETHTTYTSEYEGETLENHVDTRCEYNRWGQLIRQVTDYDGTATETIYTYDENGWPASEETRYGSGGVSLSTYTYDERGNLMASTTGYDGVVSSREEYVRDAEGRVLHRQSTGEDGTVTSASDYEYENGFLKKEVHTSGDYRSEEVYTYDERGNITGRRGESAEGSWEVSCVYDEEGLLTEYVYTDEDGVWTTRYAYDDCGRLLREEYQSPEENYLEEFVYDKEGNLLADVYTGSDYSSRTEYAYDRSLGKQTRTVTEVFPAAKEMRLSEEELTLSLEDGWLLYCELYPYNCVPESVRWSSSDESVLTVDGEGNLTPRKAGSAVVTAESESGLKASCAVTVVKDMLVLHVADTVLRMKKGETLLLHCIAEVSGLRGSYWIHNELSTTGVVEFEWNPWEGDEIDLTVTAVKSGFCTIWIWLSRETGDGDVNYEPVEVHVTVTD